MVLLAIDGNSIVNRAFYGIKLLSTKDGRFTNGIFGFLNILQSLRETYAPDCIAVAFDLHAPTFRHKMYDGYKAGRKGMPSELREQMPVLKEILQLMGIQTVELEGYEADDILGTLSVADFDKVYIATGDRDSLQLISDKANVLLTSTRMGRTQTVVYDKEKLMEDYAMTPARMIDLKALMGDSSDNIPGVPGIGQKTATDIILKYGGIDDIFNHLDTLALSPSVLKKLAAGKESAYLSYTLGTICKTVPIDVSPAAYAVTAGDPARLKLLLADLEMYKMIDKLGLRDAADLPQTDNATSLTATVCDAPENLQDVLLDGKLYLVCNFDCDKLQAAYASGKGMVYKIDGSRAAELLLLLADQQIEKYTDSSKALHRFAFSCGTEAENIVFDCEIAGYLLNPNAFDYSVLTAAADQHVPVPTTADGADSSLIRAAAVLPVVAGKLIAKIDDDAQHLLYYDVELPLAQVLASMETLGFKVDKEGILRFGDALGLRIDNLVGEIYTLAGETFNINSPKQLGAVLFEKLGLPAKKKTKTGYSTNAEVLEALAPEHPIVEKILEYRALSKLKSTYCDGLIKEIGMDGRIHSTFHQTETRTGRISSSEPNLQNIPVRSDLGREMRRFFIADNGYILSDADYSQIELRVLAHIANDTTMLNAFNHDEDIHATTASQVFGLPKDMITAALRSRAKAVNFGIVYGIGAFSLAKDIGVTRQEADRYIKAYLSHFSGVSAYMDTVIKQAKQDGYVETMFHRRRYLPELSASNAMQRNFGERVARNTPIQGTAADIIKIAMVKVYRRLKKENLKSKLILQVHDELIVETARGEEDAVAAILSYEMEHAVSLHVRLTADVHAGKSWYDAKG
ncbi:MAG: DNA polymerase I [Clostridia bacterium]|nr:DNA polymerase I [Clostridia bacterium]